MADKMYKHDLNPLKGWGPYNVDKAASYASTVVANKGSVLSLNSSAKLQLGLEEGAMPIFALQNSTDFDVVGDAGNIIGDGGKGIVSGLVAISGLELESTEYATTATYVPNQTLTAGKPGDADAGQLKVGVAYVDTICGVVSDGVVKNEYGQSVLRFWPVWLPPIPGSSSI